MAEQEPKVHIPEDELRAFCERYHIRTLAFFGSILRDDFEADSDIDILVEFEPGHVPGFAFFAMQDELSSILGRKVDLNTPGFLSPDIREKVESEASIHYAKA
jgi:predicted nucleotidyltransferase